MNRREFISQGFRAGCGGLLGTSLYSLLGPRAHAISPDLLDPVFTNYSSCDLGKVAGRKIPFICFDLAGGANIAGGNVIVGGPGGQFGWAEHRRLCQAGPAAGYSALQCQCQHPDRRLHR